MMMMIEDDTNLRFVINITALPEKNITEGSLPDLLSLLVTMISMDVELTENNSNTTTQQHNIQHSTSRHVIRPTTITVIYFDVLVLDFFARFGSPKTANISMEPNSKT